VFYSTCGTLQHEVFLQDFLHDSSGQGGVLDGFQLRDMCVSADGMYSQHSLHRQAWRVAYAV
jgi:hypothetical protein